MMGLFGTNIGDLEKRTAELNKKANNLLYKLEDLKGANKALFEELHHECIEINKGIAKVIIDEHRSDADVARVSKCATITHGILKRMGF